MAPAGVPLPAPGVALEQQQQQRAGREEGEGVAQKGRRPRLPANVVVPEEAQPAPAAAAASPPTAEGGSAPAVAGQPAKDSVRRVLDMGGAAQGSAAHEPTTPALV